jgi:predicted MFS family arabinose efflux permease
MLADGTVDEQSSGRPIRPVLVRYTTAAALARVADEGSRVALLLLVLEDGRSATFGGLLIAALMVPHVVAAPVVGALADRIRRRRPLYVAGLLGYGASLIGSALCAGPAPVAAFAFALLAGCCAPLLIGGLTSLLGELVPEKTLQRAFGLDATSYSVAGIAGPAVAAVVAAAAGGIWSVVVLAIACALSAVLMATLPIPDHTPRHERQATGGGGALTAMWRRPTLGAVTAGTTISQFGQGALPIITALLAFQLGDTALTGVALSVMAAGNLVSSLAYARFPIRRWRPESVVLVTLSLLAVPFALLPLVPGRWPTLILFAAAGMLDGPLFASLLIVRDREAPPEVRTQVFTVGAGLKVTAAAGGAALAGTATGLGAGVLLLAVAGSQLAAAGATAAFLRRRAPAVSRVAGGQE